MPVNFRKSESLSTKPFDPIAALLSGQTAADSLAKSERQSEFRSLQDNLADRAAAGEDITNSEEFRRNQVLDPINSEKQRSAIFNLKKADQVEFFTDAKIGADLAAAGDVDGLIRKLIERKEKLAGKGRDTSDTDSIIQLVINGQIDEAQALMTATANTGQELGLIKTGRSGGARTAADKDFNTFQEKIRDAENETNPEIKKKKEKSAEMFGRRARFIRETEQESADIKVDASLRKGIDKLNTERIQGFVNSGVAAADSTSNIRRSLNLLDQIGTGGYDSVKLKLNQLFGTEGANEGELNANLGQSVLAQLKPLFGAAFTANEGKRLESISAKFGSSTKSNIRLLEQILKISDRAARRGIAASEKLGDDFTAQEIRDSLSFSLSDKRVDSDKNVINNEQSNGMSTEDEAELAALEAQFGAQ
jgi:hypothetical protein